MATTSPTRIDDDLYAAAKAAGTTMSRSAAQQITHWARIGRELEAAESVSHREVAGVLAGGASYDSLNARQQAIVRAEWDERMTSLREGLDFEAEFTAEGGSWVEAESSGRTVERDAIIAASGTASPRSRPSRKPGRAG